MKRVFPYPVAVAPAPAVAIPGQALQAVLFGLGLD
jgi:hypothetical protein